MNDPSRRRFVQSGLAAGALADVPPFARAQQAAMLKVVWQREAATFNSDLWRITQAEFDSTALPRPATPGFREYEDILRVALRDMQAGGSVAQTLTGAAQKMDRELAKYK